MLCCCCCRFGVCDTTVHHTYNVLDSIKLGRLEQQSDDYVGLAGGKHVRAQLSDNLLSVAQLRHIHTDILLYVNVHRLVAAAQHKLWSTDDLTGAPIFVWYL